MLTVALYYLFPILMICAALWDVATLQIPNWLCLAVLLSFLMFSAAAPLEVADIIGRIGLGVAVLIAGTFLFIKGYAGGGDIKLLAAAAVWVGWPHFPSYLVATAFIGGILALVVLAFQRFELPASWASVGWLQRLHSREKGIPYGVAIAAAGVLISPQLPLL